MAAQSGSDEELQRIKSEILSLLVSNPSKTVPLNQFLRDFKTNVGKPLPFKEFNYNSPLQFLRTLTDIVQIIDAVDCARLSAVPTELSSHISDMVDHQKKNVRRRPMYSNITYYPPATRAWSSKPYFPPQPLMNAPFYPAAPLYAPVMPQQSYGPVLNPSAPPFTYNFSGPPLQYNFRIGAGQHGGAGRQPAPHPEPNGDLGVPKSNDIDQAAASDVDPVADVIPSRDVIENQAGDDTSADHRDVIKDSSCPIFVDKPDSSTDNHVLDHASLDVQTSGQENQNSLSPVSLSETSKHSDSLNPIVKSKVAAVLEEHANGVPSSLFMSLYKSLHADSLDLASLGYSSLKEMVLKNEDLFSFEKAKTSDDWILYDARLKPRRRQNHVQSSGWIPNCVVDNLASLARKHEDGIDADLIVRLYKEEFNTEINPEILGFDSLYALLEKCKSISFRQYGDKGMVYPKVWVYKPDDKQTSGIKEPAHPPPEEMKSLWKDGFKEYECDPSFKLKLPLIPEDKLLQVKIVDLNSPALMWIQFLDDAKRLNDMMYEMNLHYDSHHEDYRIPENFILPGLAVVSMFAGKWHRATIVSVKNELAEVFYVDYGTTCSAYISELRKLDKKFGQDRVYAIKASLFCLVPYKGDVWSVESCDFLYSRYAEKIVYAELCAVNYQEPFVEVIIFDTSTDVEININDLLVSEKLARYMTNPVSEIASIINERTVTRFYKFLPRWFSTSMESDSDVGLCYKNLMICTSAESVPINSGEIPCCKIHCIQTLCQANAELMASVWDNAIRQEEERIINNVMGQVEESIKELGWEPCLNSQLCCTTSEPLETQRDCTTEEPITCSVPIDTRNSHQNGILHPELEMRRPRNTMPEPNEVMSSLTSKSLSTMGYHSPWLGFGNRNKPSKRPDRRRIPRSQMMTRVVTCLETKFNENTLSLIIFNGEIRVCLSELFQLTKLPSMLVKNRFERSDVKADKLIVCPSRYPDLYNDLLDLELVPLDEDPTLVLLSDAPIIIRVLDPVGQYKEPFEDLAKKIAELMDTQEPPRTDYD